MINIVKANYHFWVGRYHFSQGNYQKAKEQYEMAVGLAPKFYEGWNNLGITYRLLGNYEKAIDCSQTAVNLYPGYADGWFNMGLTNRELAKYKSAIDCFYKVLELRSGDALAWVNLGWCDMALGEYREAIECFHNALKINNRFVDALNYMGLAYQNLGDSSRAIYYYEKVLEINPEHKGAKKNLENTLNELEQRKKEVTKPKEVVVSEDDDPDVFSKSLICDKTENDVVVKRGFVPWGDTIKFGFRVENQTHYIIHEVEVKLDYPKDILELVCAEGSQAEGRLVYLQKIRPGEARTAIYYIKPKICAISRIGGVLFYIDYQDNKIIKKIPGKFIEACQFVKPKFMSQDEFQEEKQNQKLKESSIVLENVENFDSLVQEIQKICGLSLVSINDDNVQFSGESLTHEFFGLLLKKVGTNAELTALSPAEKLIVGFLSEITQKLSTAITRIKDHDAVMRVKLGEIAKTIPLPSHIEVIPGKVRDTLRLNFTCGCNGEQIGEIYDKEWRKWVKLLAYGVKTGVRIVVGDYGHAARELKDALDLYRSKETIPDQTFLLTQQEKDELLKKLRESKILEKIQYCPECMCWVCFQCWDIDKKSCKKHSNTSNKSRTPP
ncbi:MAG: tetratricopeptide repeat protein [Promethearchaeota archaeon]